ncbi:hypothetical protein DDB_G0294392 [Dictyostelium discoideum AX4]|uniref:hypothetical protein n=1 Tax=Dictyostelium discoideum AX4 TaxID=352472 RepID=UPI00004E54CA|nr:hypothetical protein DDB_G0294392 [Dictyostelium discoideum AX4]EAL60289.1 hypothetical protein DDB_G0294392 [Dictyostelium discoideum AX4]|eukprot:XP_628702.1 hypothetical protein DDB_G0294392 [Dictyostelium discoideum AX4]
MSFKTFPFPVGRVIDSFHSLMNIDRKIHRLFNCISRVESINYQLIKNVKLLKMKVIRPHKVVD